MKRILICFFSAILAFSLISSPLQASAEEVEAICQVELTLPCKSAVLIEQTTGEILYEKNPDERLPIASVTKIMTLLLVMEALEEGTVKLTDNVPVSELAASM